ALSRRCISLFKDIVDELCDKALHFIAYEAPKDAENAIAALDNISLATRFKTNEITEKEVTERSLEKSNNEAGISLSINPRDIIDLTLGDKGTAGTDIEKTTKY